MLQDLLTIGINFIIYVISTLGYAGVGLLMAVQTIAIPMPSEIIIPFAGFLVYTGRFNIFLVALTGGLGSMAGSFVAYKIGAIGGRPLVEKYGRMIMISQHDLDLADKFFLKHGTKAVFFGMMLPVVRSFISFPAGISKVPIKKFLAYVFFASFIWCFVLAFLGMKLGENWASLRNKFHNFDNAIIVLIVMAGMWWVYRHIKQSRKS